MRGILSFWRLSVGKKVVMAVTGVALLGFVIGHMLGNLKIFLGPEVYNHYATGLRTLGAPFLADEQLLWIARLGLLVCLVLHVVAVVQLWQQDRAARPLGYEKRKWIAFSWASAWMLTGGLAVGLFVLYHLAHLTFGWVHQDLFELGDPYHNVVAGFQQWPIALLYLLAMVPLCVHLYHGVWSAFQTLGIANPRVNRWRRPLAMMVALVIFLGNSSIPLAALTGLLRLPQ